MANWFIAELFEFHNETKFVRLQFVHFVGLFCLDWLFSWRSVRSIPSEYYKQAVESHSALFSIGCEVQNINKAHIHLAFRCIFLAKDRSELLTDLVKELLLFYVEQQLRIC